MLPNWMARSHLVEIELVLKFLEEMLRELKGAQAPNEKLEECENWLRDVRRTISKIFISHYDYDWAWAALREVRHKLCGLLPADGLQRIAIEIEEELEYVAQGPLRDSLQMEAAALVTQLVTLQQAEGADPRSLDKCRAELLKLSIIAASARLEHWHKINMLRARVQATAMIVLLLALLLLLAILARPGFFGFDERSRVVIFGVILFGGLGGFISALRQYEPLAAIGSGFYVERMLLGLRPLVGAVAGLVLYLGQISKIVNIIPEPGTAGYFFVAFCAGFSEQFFLGNLKKEAGGEKKKQEEKREQ